MEAMMHWRLPHPPVAGSFRRLAAICALAALPTIAIPLAHGQERTLPCVDPRTGAPLEIRGVRVHAGAIDSTWVPDSTRLCVGSTEGALPLAVSDGAGGSYIAWLDNHGLE